MFFLFLSKTFCCVDKSGVLSYPNLTPAKVFMFKSMLSEEDINEQQKASVVHTETPGVEETKEDLDISKDDGTFNESPCLHLYQIYDFLMNKVWIIA